MTTFIKFFLQETCSWDRPVATLYTNSHPLTMAFHSFDKQLIMANESDMIRCVVSQGRDCPLLTYRLKSVYDWHHRKRLSYFCNGNYKGTSITALDIINQDVGGIIITGSGKKKIRSSGIDF
jgi:regulatory associated protein of mTOR